MRIGLIDADQTSWRNLHLMRRAAYHKSRGDTVLFPYDGAHPVDLVVISVVFTSNRPKVEAWLQQIGDTPVEIGGTGWDLTVKAPPEVEACQPDYSIYDGLLGPAKYRQGRTSEGCPRACQFCVVPELYNRKVRPVTTLADIFGDGPKLKRIKLMDDNFLASSTWEDRILEALEGGYRLSFTQGLDVRFVDEHKAELLGRLWRAKGIWDEDFHNRDVTFAFDSLRTEKAYRRGFDLLTGAGIPAGHIKSFVLTGFDSAPEDDMRRLAVLRELGALPFLMVYQPIHGEDMPEFYRSLGWTPFQYKRHLARCGHLARYCNRLALWKKLPNFGDYSGWARLQERWQAEDRQTTFAEV